MPKCHIIGCEARKSKNQPNLTFHQLPKNKNKRKKWLEIIGVNNILDDFLGVHICSLHFDESLFYKTSTCVKLREGALPTLQLPKNGDPPEDITYLEVDTQIPGTSSIIFQDEDSKDITSSTRKTLIRLRHVIDIPPLSTKEVSSPVVSPKNKRLEEKCAKLNKKIEHLQEQLLARMKEISDLKQSLSNKHEQELTNKDNEIVIIQLGE